MLATIPALLGALGEGAAPLIRPGTVRSPAVLLRAQTTSLATVLQADGSTWIERAADIARFNASGRRLLIEGQRMNGIRNPRFEGATPGVIGSGGVAPTNMNLTPVANHTVEIVAIGTVQGLPCMELQLTATAAATSTLSLEASSGIALAASALYTASAFAQRTAGATTNISTLAIRGRTDLNTASNWAQASLLGMPTDALARFSASTTTAADAVSGRMSLIFITTGAASIRFRLAAPQLGAGAFASTPILPAIGSPAAATRGADLVTAALSSLGLPASGAGTLLWSGMLPQAAPAGRVQTILQIDDGTSNNGFALLNPGGGASIVARRMLAGATADVTLGSMTPGTAFRLGMAMNGAGRIAAGLNGGSVQAVTGGPTSGLTTLRIGNAAAGDRALFGEVAALGRYRFALADAALPAAIMATPL